jgi:hypothetical protein
MTLSLTINLTTTSTLTIVLTSIKALKLPLKTNLRVNLICPKLCRKGAENGGVGGDDGEVVHGQGVLRQHKHTVLKKSKEVKRFPCIIYCQAQPKPQLNWAELALFMLSEAHPHSKA